MALMLENFIVSGSAFSFFSLASEAPRERMQANTVLFYLLTFLGVSWSW
jgi:hypothetical protein